MKKKLKILCVEDSLTDFELVMHEIKKGKIEFEYRLVETKEEYVFNLKSFNPDLILSDFSLPKFSGMAALLIREEITPQIPFILITGTIDEETAVEVMKSGADDYLIKENLTRLVPAIKSAIEKKKIIKDKLQAEKDKERLLLFLRKRIKELKCLYSIMKITEKSEISLDEIIKDIAIILPSGWQYDKIAGARIIIKNKEYKTPNFKDSKLKLSSDIVIRNIIEGEITVCYIDDKLKKNNLRSFLKEEINLIESVADQLGKTIERKQAEEQLLKFKLGIERSEEIIFITDLDGIITFTNPAFEKIYGYSKKEVIGKTPSILKSGVQSPDFYKNYWTYLTDKTVVSCEFVNKKKDGTMVVIENSANPIIDETDKIVGYIAIQRDITKRLEAENELILAKDRAEESNRLKTAFLANMSHEIRTPMNGILGFSSLLKDPNLLGAEKEKYIDIIEKSGDRMLNIIDDIINISKIESGLMTVNLSKTNINQLIKDIYTFFKPEVDKKGMKLSYQCSLPSDDAMLNTDSEKVNSVLLNLVKNAIKYTEKGSIELGYTTNGKFIEFYIKDTGIGIQKDRQEAVFERFIQADIEDKMARQGAGLGLSISKAYIEMLKGKIWLKSEEGCGSTFYFALPYNSTITEVNPKKNKIFETKQEGQIKKLKTILIAEDDKASEIFISLVVENFANKIITVKSGIEAVEICRKNSDIDLILMDILMPELNGYEATAQIREFNKNVIIIAQTAYAIEGDREKAIVAGCDEYISKPIKRNDLKQLISEFF